MTYQEYIASDKWRERRKRILERDNYHCMLCHSTERLEVHHNTYQRFSNEDDDDLVTLCRECHERVTSFQREKRYSKRIHKPEELSTIIIDRKEIRYGSTKVSLYDQGDSTIDPAQRSTRRSDVQIYKADEGNIIEEEQDGCGPGGIGTSGMVRSPLYGRRKTSNSSVCD